MSLQPNEWDQFRRSDDTIDLFEVWGHKVESDATSEEIVFVSQYFRAQDKLQRINSRQAAAVAICAVEMAIKMNRKFNL